jgi:hypothetical protein
MTGYSVDHVEHVIKQFFVKFNIKTYSWVLCALYKSDTLTTEVPCCPRASVVKTSRCSGLDENQAVLPAH